MVAGVAQNVGHKHGGGLTRVLFCQHVENSRVHMHVHGKLLL